jgi:hypothetical protein
MLYFILVFLVIVIPVLVFLGILVTLCTPPPVLVVLIVLVISISVLSSCVLLVHLLHLHGCACGELSGDVRQKHVGCVDIHIFEAIDDLFLWFRWIPILFPLFVLVFHLP